MRRGSGACAVALVVLLFGACAGDSGSDQGPATGETSEPAETAAPAVPDAPAPGTGVVVVGGTSSTFEVTSCRLEPDPNEPEGARALLSVQGEGTTPSGVGFTIEVERFVTGLEAQTFTDTITYADTGRILQAQRIEVNGQITDLRDPEAATPLIRPRDDGLSAAGRAGPPGGGGEATEGIVGLSLNVTCET